MASRGLSDWVDQHLLDQRQHGGLATQEHEPAFIRHLADGVWPPTGLVALAGATRPVGHSARAAMAAALLFGSCAAGGYGEVTENEAGGRLAVWPGLRLLDLSGSPVGAAAVNDALAATAASLRVLRLDGAACLHPLQRTAGLSGGEPRWSYARQQDRGYTQLGGAALLLRSRLGGYRTDLKSLPKLVELSCAEAYGLDGAAAVAIGRAAPRLRRLRLADDGIPADEWATLLQSLGKLEELRVSNSALGAAAVAGLLSKRSGLQAGLTVLELAGCPAVSDQVLASSCWEGLQRLVSLRLASCGLCRGLELAAAAAARGKLGQLVALDLREAQGLPDPEAARAPAGWVAAVLAGCPGLRRLELSGCVAAPAAAGHHDGLEGCLRLVQLGCGWLLPTCLGQLRFAESGRWGALRALELGIGARTSDAVLVGLARVSPTPRRVLTLPNPPPLPPPLPPPRLTVDPVAADGSRVRLGWCHCGSRAV